ncbi:hypothetical protein A2631_01260 [Candidatus Daviesbacteria bacterium RIFCSPHIGHO2_01_FULL_44_29]|uniref:Purple acid phosphatase N-terminal domain-containing protein n=1 Tax=Candidatus Daviesbacteria bacterium RIFCSPHIGHO2_02_FULL_43_12 TaxID=1797776 RepID=A0A1F5KL29_9BACT|nr:MAG: hypothetical protein A2631_01260 [Candidatus Daviesbacteria bacterium RIFCSPHIGHO2_01_FULL_44_29]OGE38901.1 MAG: hypothetical protein A3E86_04070 [Candidatus Daviesbacteria bacterium RIFCSPHIGHO2_12_FULL_47_45]OGE41520.1 MAG: hypothetical protein A3D25_00680 [Candidatus Daviesbacteria bacterium RIFCSPHIGHO2_02_FULL_43_12]OGE69803.1 MAG: hypothetical protein A3B55_05325 [Candidatus Daviesbacteria bacterium RIFCSPLOWO2_01_FULL_43_15]
MIKIFGAIIIVILILGVILGVNLSSQKTSYRSFASPSFEPLDVRISNQTDNSLSISWLTKNKTVGFIAYGTTPELGQAYADDRDKDGRAERLTHYVTLKNLDPQTEIYFRISSGSEIFDQKGQPFLVKTAPTSGTTPEVSLPLAGSVSGADQDTLIFARVDSGSLISTYPNSGGRWVLPLNNSRTTDLKAYLKLGDTSQIALFAQTSNGTTQQKLILKKALEVVNLNIVPNATPEASFLATLTDLTLYESPATQITDPEDLNRDGQVNIFDRILKLRQLLK